MKKTVVVSILFFGGLLLSGCSVQSVQETLEKLSTRVMQKDQSFEQGFEVTPEFLAEHFTKDAGYLDLSKLGLTAIPDVCGLLSGDLIPLVQFFSLAQNKIRVVDQDLSCLTNLRVLNLSYNQITEVVSLGSLPALQELLLHKNNITDAESVGLMNLPALQKLNLGYNNLKSFVPSSGLSNLTVLELQHNALESLVGVENLKQLQELKVEFNKLNDLPFLDQLKSIKSVTTEGNTLSQTISDKAKAIQEAYMKLRTGATGTGQVASGN